MDDNKKKIIDTVEKAKSRLLELSMNIHENPELGYNEHKAVKFITETLESFGYKAQTNYCGVETSFRCDVKVKEGAPTLAILAEYDALPGVGHGCGHNLIATCSTGAFLALASVADKLQGNIALIGTPAEEGGGGKIKLLRNGAFDDIDYALMMHPSGGGSNLVGRGGRAACDVDIKFIGKGAHSSDPASGINALSAVINVFNQIDILRSALDPQDNLNGIITNGGVANNIIPAEAACSFCIRADTMARIEELIEILRKCTKNSENLFGAKAEFSYADIYAERYPNKPMNQAFKDNMAELGINMTWPDPNKQYGSSDIGNVSIKIPIIHDYLSITDDKTIAAHTVEYAAAAATPYAQEVCLKGAMGLAMTGYDVLTSEEFRKEINRYHDEQVPDFYKK